MNKSLILLDSHIDPLWRRYLLRVFHDSLFVDLSDPAEQQEIPHYNNFAGWQQWLKERQIGQIICIEPGHRSHLILTAGVLNRISLTLYFTRGMTAKLSGRSRVVDRWVHEYRCADAFIKGQLCLNGIKPEKVTVEVPNIEMIQIGDDRRKELRRKMGDGPVLLALPRPDEKKQLYSMVWATAILKHIHPDLRLIVTGNYTAFQQQSIFNWQRDLLADGMIYLDNTNDFDALAATCDVVVAGDGASGEVIRMLHAMRSGKDIIATDGLWKEYLHEHAQGHIVPKNQPRDMASAILSLLEKAQAQAPFNRPTPNHLLQDEHRQQADRHR